MRAGDTQKAARVWQRQACVRVLVFGGLNHLTTTGSGFINPCRVVAPHRTAVTPPQPPSLPPAQGEHDHMQPSAHMGAHVGELEFGSVRRHFNREGALQIHPLISSIDKDRGNADDVT